MGSRRTDQNGISLGLLFFIAAQATCGCGGVTANQVYVVEQDKAQIYFLDQIGPRSHIPTAVVLDSRIETLVRGDKLRVIEVNEGFARVNVLSGTHEDTVGWVVLDLLSPDGLIGDESTADPGLVSG